MGDDRRDNPQDQARRRQWQQGELFPELAPPPAPQPAEPAGETPALGESPPPRPADEEAGGEGPYIRLAMLDLGSPYRDAMDKSRDVFYRHVGAAFGVGLVIAGIAMAKGGQALWAWLAVALLAASVLGHAVWMLARVWWLGRLERREQAQTVAAELLDEGELGARDDGSDDEVLTVELGDEDDEGGDDGDGPAQGR